MSNIGLTVVKNEEEIIEVFCRHNLNLLDKIYIVDNCSTDNTIDIINSLINEGLPIKLIVGFPDIVHNQEVAMTETLHIIKKDHPVNLTFLLDADEFINTVRDKRTFQAELSKLDRSYIHDILWQIYVPSEELSDTDNYVKLVTNRRLEEKFVQWKIIVPSELVEENIMVSSGNHGIKIKGDPDSYNFLKHKPIISAKLAHIPVRTESNTIRRLLLNSHTLSIKPNRDKFIGEGYHWDIFAEFIRKRNYKLSFNDLKLLALNYGYAVFEPNSVIEDPIKSFDNVYVKYTNRNNPIMYFDKYIGNLIKNME